MTSPDVSLNQTVYMKGTRRIDEMAATARQLAFQENYSYTEGWSDNTVGAIFNLGLNQLYDKICQIDNVANIEEYTQDVIAGQQEYDIPADVNLQIMIMNVRFLYGTQSWEFVTLEQGMIQDRSSYPTNIPSQYCIRNGKILLSPTPNISRTGALIINYQKRVRSLDYRRGQLASSASGIITGISTANPAVVTCASAHGLSTGQRVSITGSFEPSNLLNGNFSITVTGANTFSLDGVDTTSMAAFSGTAKWFIPPVSAYGLVSNITNANPAVVTTIGNHGLSTGAVITLNGPNTAQPLSLMDRPYVITVLSPTSFSLNGVDSTILGPFTGPVIWMLSPNTFTLNFNITSQKDANLQPNANAILDKVDWLCFVDRNGESVLDAIPINNYNTTTGVITTELYYVVPYDEFIAFLTDMAAGITVYVVTGDYASTHSFLDRKAEDLLIEYVVLRLLRLQSAAEPTVNQFETEEAVLNRLAIAYRRYRPSVNPIIWQKRLRTQSWYFNMRGPY